MAMSDKTVEVVKQTAPVVAEHANEITACFYTTMFKNDPAALHFFNETHQDRGEQQRALADAVVAYASNIDNLGALVGAVERIAHRHVALSVLPEHYPIVHRNMMSAIGQTLGGAVTPEIGAAWSEAVSALAKICIDAEEGLYQAQAARAGGWRGEKEFRLVKKELVAEDTMAFSFARADYDGGFEFTAGQYLTVRVPALGLAPRHYTLTSRPGDKVLQCAVRRLPGSRSGAYMHEELKEGDTVLLGVPSGLFAAHVGDGPKVLVSAGIGATASWSILQSYGPSVKAVLHVDRSEQRHAFRQQFQKSGVPCTFLYTTQKGRPEVAPALAELVAKAGADAQFFVCGPTGFMVAARDALKSLGVANVRCELFSTGAVPQPIMRCPFAKGSGPGHSEVVGL